MATRKSLNGQSPLVNGSILTVEIPDSQAAPAKTTRTRKVAPPVEAQSEPQTTADVNTEKAARKKAAAEKGAATRAANKAAAAEKAATEATLTATEKASAAEKTATVRHRTARAVEVVSVVALLLSIGHCKEAVALWTGSSWFTSLAMAITIDAGLLATEMAEIVSYVHEKILRRWCYLFIVMSGGLSCALNAYAFSLHATYKPAGVALGILIPILVLILGRIRGYLVK